MTINTYFGCAFLGEMEMKENRDQLKLFEEKATPPSENKSCAFCSIVRDEKKSLVVYSDSFTLAFLDRKPVFLGHTLVIPKSHYETLADLPDYLVHTFFSTVQLMSKAVQNALGSDGTFVAMNNRVSQSVPHLHVHVVPRRMHDGLRGFFWPRQAYRDENEAREVAEKVRRSASDIFLSSQR
jgi:histidine triad (HIT) family protein